MSDVWRIFVVEGDEALNQTIVTSLRKDGYIVQGVTSGADAVRVLWSEEYDVVLCNLKTPGADGFELLQWLRMSRPNTRMILVGGPDSADLHMQALESGASSYLEMPLELHQLKEELRRLLQQTGFSANLDSFDLLDVIQIITMSRNSIALLVNTGLEERGLLCFKGGDLVWAEYGILRGEEAFFALAAHKNGTVTQQPWNEQVTANVMQPLSRLIFQALQYRTKYADQQPYSGEQIPVLRQNPYNGEFQMNMGALNLGDEDDTPFGVLGDALPMDLQDVPFNILQEPEPTTSTNNREWWEKTGALPNLGYDGRVSGPVEALSSEAAPTMAIDGQMLSNGAMVPSSPVYKTPGSQNLELPAWLTDQPTSSDIPVVRPSSLMDSARVPAIPATPIIRSSSPDWQSPRSLQETGQAGQPIPKPTMGGQGQTTGAQKPVTGVTGSTGAQRKWVISDQKTIAGVQRPLVADSGVSRTSPEWRVAELQGSITQPGNTVLPAPQAVSETKQNGTSATTGAFQVTRRNYNYSALVSALQTLGYSISGFVAAAVVDMDGQPIAQVAVDDLDISRICQYFSVVLKNILLSLDQGMRGGGYEHTIITSVGRHILMRVVGEEKVAFQVLITTREAEPAQSLEVMANVEGAISAALHS